MPHYKVDALTLKVGRKAGKVDFYLSGLNQCGRVWDCPICAARIADGRLKELASLIRKHDEAGGSVWMTALTIPHKFHDDLYALKSALRDVWKEVQQSDWRKKKLRCGIIGNVRSLEVTYGKNGWHPHIHVLFFARSGALEGLIEEFGKWLFERWARIVRDKGLGKCNPDIYSFTKARSSQQVGEYIVKWGTEREILGAQSKAAKSGNKTPWQLVEEAGRGNKRSAALFAIYSKAMKGTRQLGYSTGIRKLYDLAEPLSDEELAAQEPRQDAGEDGGAEYVSYGYLGREVGSRAGMRNLWDKLRLRIREEPPDFWQATVSFLAENGIPIDRMCGRIHPSDIYEDAA